LTNGIHTDEEKIKAIEQVPPPTNVKQLQAFLGLFSNYHKYIPEAATILAPLYALLHKNKNWHWSGDCNQAFNNVKKFLLESNFLTYFKPDAITKLRTDASPYGIAGVLLQVIDNEERPVAFASQTLSETEQKYLQLDKEALAITFLLEKFHKYLFGIHFTLQTDNRALTFLFNPHKSLSKIVYNRLQRYVLILSGYNYSID